MSDSAHEIVNLMIKIDQHIKNGDPGLPINFLPRNYSGWRKGYLLHLDDDKQYPFRIYSPTAIEPRHRWFPVDTSYNIYTYAHDMTPSGKWKIREHHE